MFRAVCNVVAMAILILGIGTVGYALPATSGTAATDADLAPTVMDVAVDISAEAKSESLPGTADLTPAGPNFHSNSHSIYIEVAGGSLGLNIRDFQTSYIKEGDDENVDIPIPNRNAAFEIYTTTGSLAGFEFHRTPEITNSASLFGFGIIRPI